MQLADFKCEGCDKVYEDLQLRKKHSCDCGGKLLRIYSFSKPPEFIPGEYENFEDKPIYIESRDQFKRECKKRNLERVH